MALADQIKGVYVSQKAKTAFEEATIGLWRLRQLRCVHVPTHTVGVTQPARLWSTAGRRGVSYAAAEDSWSQTWIPPMAGPTTTGILKAGRYHAGRCLYAVNPVPVSTGRLQTFTVLADADTGASTGPVAARRFRPDHHLGRVSNRHRCACGQCRHHGQDRHRRTPYKQSLLLAPKCFASCPVRSRSRNGAGVKTSTRWATR